MDSLLQVFLPLSLAFIMFSLGLGLTLRDFTRVLRQPMGFFAGAAAQIILLPLVAYLLVLSFGITGELAVGVMILSVCPGGVTSNMMTRLAGGNLALSISLTGVASLLSVITVPVMVVFWAGLFLGDAAPDIDITSLALAMFAITAVPVALGMVLRGFAPGLVARVERAVTGIATVLFVVIIVGALVSFWDVFVGNIATLGPLLAVMVAVLLGIGWGVAALLGLDVADRAAISVEAGIQNGTLGIAVAGLIVGGESVLSALALPSGVYGILMYVIGVPAVLLMRRMAR
ncbi:MAG: bile acid:sodium symporter family protein [Pseudomonadota bacterium]